MRSTSPFRRPARLLLATLALGAAAACNDSTAPDDDDHAAEVEMIRLTVAGGAGGTYTVSDGGVLTPSPLRLPVGTATVTATFLDHDGEDISDEIHDDEYEVRFTSLPTGVTFARTGAFSGTFTGAAAATGNMRVALFHLGEGHEDLGPFTIAVQIGG